MPWTVDDVDRHKKGLTEEQKELWVKVANAALKRCQEQGGDNCEASAIMQANAVVAKNMSYEDWLEETKKKYVEQTFNLHGVEIFAVGTWNGDIYTEKDLDSMVEAFDQVGFKPPLKLGHNMEQEKQWKDGQPAFGWVGKIYRRGKKLLADFVQLPRKIYEALKRGNYKQISSEIYWNLERNGRVFPRVLRAVALLGADIPAVSGLEAIENLYNEQQEDDVRIYAEWDTAYVNRLPDAAFAVILPGGEKDEEGKTTPRNLRKLPHHTMAVKDPAENESVDKPHLRNALARLPQTDMPVQYKEKALNHLRAHAKALGIGEAAEMAEKEIEKEVKKMNELQEQLEKAKSELENLKKEKETLEVKYNEIENEKKKTEAALAEERAKAKASQVKFFIEEQKKAGKVLPRFEKELEAILMSASDEKKVFTYTDDKEKKVELTQRETIERMIELFPKIIEFAELAGDDDIDLSRDYEYDPGVEVDRRAKLYMDKGRAKTYEEAIEKVLNDDLELKKKYLGGE